MSTPGAIAVYTSGEGTPEHVGARPWRGVYHHWDGGLRGLGEHLIARVEACRGDVPSVVAQLIDGAPWGWSSCLEAPLAAKHSILARILARKAVVSSRGGQLSRDEPGLAVSPTDTRSVAFVYVFDTEARRLDAFATHAGGSGQRIGSVCFAADGTPDARAFDLTPEEQVLEPPLPGKALSAQGLQAMLAILPPLATTSSSLQWVSTQERADGALVVVFRVLELSDGALEGIVEREWPLVPPSARLEPDRVRNCLEALVDVLGAANRFDGFAIASLDPLRRSGARTRATFVTVLRASGIG